MSTYPLSLLVFHFCRNRVNVICCCRIRSSPSACLSSIFTTDRRVAEAFSGTRMPARLNYEMIDATKGKEKNLTVMPVKKSLLTTHIRRTNSFGISSLLIKCAGLLTKCERVITQVHLSILPPTKFAKLETTKAASKVVALPVSLTSAACFSRREHYERGLSVLYTPT